MHMLQQGRQWQGTAKSSCACFETLGFQRSCIRQTCPQVSACFMGVGAWHMTGSSSGPADMQHVGAVLACSRICDLLDVKQKLLVDMCEQV